MNRETRQFLQMTPGNPPKVGTDAATQIGQRKAHYPLWAVPMLFGLESIAVLILVRAATIDPERLGDRAALSIAFFAAVLAAAGIRTVMLWRRQKSSV